MRDARSILRGLAAIAALTLSAISHAAEMSGSGLTLGPADSSNVLVVHASNSVQVFRGVLEDFSRLNPSVRLEYTELSTQEMKAAPPKAMPPGPSPAAKPAKK